jgi:hypothetical protein
MKITTEDGKEFELKEFEALIPESLTASTGITHTTRLYALKPVKKTEKYGYKIMFVCEIDYASLPRSIELTLNPTTAHKLSEAISALVEYMQTDLPEHKWDSLEYQAKKARESFKESQ